MKPYPALFAASFRPMLDSPCAMPLIHRRRRTSRSNRHIAEDNESGERLASNPHFGTRGYPETVPNTDPSRGSSTALFAAPLVYRRPGGGWFFLAACLALVVLGGCADSYTRIACRDAGGVWIATATFGNKPVRAFPAGCYETPVPISLVPPRGSVAPPPTGEPPR